MLVMNLPSAVRKDRDVGALVGLHFLSPVFAVLAFLRWTSFACPHCDGVFRRDYWPHNVRLGNGERICRNCARVFDDGSREWKELDGGLKFRFLFPPGILAIIGGLLLTAIVALLIAPRDVRNFLIGLLIVAVSLSPAIVWCLIRMISIYRSNRRYEDNPSTVQRRFAAGGH
jgi:hypothetical protein